MLKSVEKIKMTFILSNFILYTMDLVRYSPEFVKVPRRGLSHYFSSEKKLFRLVWVRNTDAWTREDFPRHAGLQGDTQRKFYLHITSPLHENIVCFCYIWGDKMWWFLVNADCFVSCFDWMKCLLEINELLYAFYCTFWC